MSGAPETNAPEAARLRAAHELLNERPSPRVRAAVLRAARASAHGEPPSESVTARGKHAPRWLRWQPLAAAGATAAVTVLAIGISLQLEHQKPAERRFETPATPALPAAASASAPAAAAERAAPLQRVQKKVVPPASAAAPVPAPSAPGDSKEANAIVEQRRTPVQAADKFDRQRTEKVPTAGAVSPTPPAAAQMLDSKARAASITGGATPSPDQWLRRIVELRQAGKDAQADDELTRFVAAFPDTRIPAEAQKRGESADRP